MNQNCINLEQNTEGQPDSCDGVNPPNVDELDLRCKMKLKNAHSLLAATH